MNALLFLPTWLQVDVLEMWLLLSDVAILDSAFCNYRDRKRWQKAFNHPIYDYVHPYFRVERLQKKTQYTQAQKLDAMAEFMGWVFVRHVRVREIYVEIQSDWPFANVLEWLHFEDYLQVHGRYVTRLIFAGDDGVPGIIIRSVLEAIIAHCTNITHVTCAQSFAKPDFEQIVIAWPSLRMVIISGSNANNGLHVFAANCDSLTEITLRPAVPEHLWTYRPLTGTFFNSINPTLVSFQVNCCISNSGILCLTQRCPQLHTLHGVLLELNDLVLIEIADRCPLLRAIDLSESPSVTIGGITQFAQRLRLTELHTRCLDDAVVSVVSNLRTLQVTGYEHSLPIPETLAAHCTQLREFSTSRNMAETALIALAHGCRWLETLQADTAATDAVLTALSVHCPFLSSLHLRLHTGSVSDTGVCALAQGCPKLRGLSTRLVMPVSMVGITALATHCRRLHVIHVSHSVVRNAVYYCDEIDEITVLKLRVVVDTDRAHQSAGIHYAPPKFSL